MDLLKQFQQYIIKEKLFQPKDRLLIAVSGGVDSVVLCELCKRSRFDFEIAHCNFQLRGEESDADENFVSGLAVKYDVPFHLKKFDTAKYAEENKLSIQVAARNLRYNWFQELLDIESLKALDYLLTAHHADDNIETVMMNFFKGSGINGLKGILPKHDKIVRPLLFVSKENIHLFATEHKLNWREDSSNNADKYTRNYFRNQLIPGLQEVFPQVKQNLADNINRFRDVNVIYNNAMSVIKKKLLLEKGNEIHIPALKLAKTEALQTVVYEIITEHGFIANQVDEVIKLLNSESGKYVASGSHRILRNRKWLIISALNEPGLSHYLIEEADKQVSFPAGEIKVDKTENLSISTDVNVVVMDATQIKFPLLLRRWKQGDYFYPLGMKHKKKLSRFFIDQKLSLNEKENTWVIEMNKKIIWVVGMRIDDRFKISDQTSKVLKLNFLKK